METRRPLAGGRSRVGEPSGSGDGPVEGEGAGGVTPQGMGGWWANAKTIGGIKFTIKMVILRKAGVTPPRAEKEGAVDAGDDGLMAPCTARRW